MKNNNFWIACFLLVAAQLRAQYFQGKYTQDAFCGGTGMNGMTSRSTGDGHLLGGLNVRTWFNGGCNDYAFFVTRTGYSGVYFNPGEFNTSYIINDITGNQLRISSSQVVEYFDSTGFAVVFTYFPYANGVLCPGTGPGNLTMSALGFVRLDAMGNIMNSSGYGIPTIGRAYVQGIAEAPTAPSRVLVTGELDTGEKKELWAACIDQNCTMLWGHLYYSSSNSMTPYDIMNASGGPTVAIVGTTNATGSGTSDAFILNVDLYSGAINTCKTFRSGTVNKFHSIKVHPNPGPGYIIAGTIDANCWLLKTDWNFNPMWWQRYQVYRIPSQIRDVNGLGVRINTAGNLEYYMGATIGPPGTNADAMVLKVGQNGNPVNPGSVFLYNTGAEETVVSLDLNTSGTWDGVSLYGVVEGAPNPTNREGLIIKSFFNGVTDCNASFFDAGTVPTQITFSTLPVSLTPLGPSYPFGSYVTYPNAFNLLCNDFRVPGGDNARTASAAGINGLSSDDAEALSIFPNPCTANEQLKLQVSSQKDETVTIKIINLLGSVIIAEQVSLVTGPNHITLTLANARLASGIYQVSIENTSGIKTQKLIVK